MTENSFTGRRELLLKNYADIKRRVQEAAVRAGRDPSEIKLMAVTKTMPAEDVNVVIDAGVTLYGENRVQELMDKQPLLHPCEAHFIGTLQRNKVKYLINRVSVIQSVGSLGVLEEIGKRAAAAGKVMKVMLEINIGGETQKSGFSPDELDGILEIVSKMEHVFVTGLMTVPPVCEKEEEITDYFAKMEQLFIDNRSKKSDNIDMTELSMGMSHDFEIAIAHGATIVRVGSALFGQRNYAPKAE